MHIVLVVMMLYIHMTYIRVCIAGRTNVNFFLGIVKKIESDQYYILVSIANSGTSDHIYWFKLISSCFAVAYKVQLLTAMLSRQFISKFTQPEDILNQELLREFVITTTTAKKNSVKT